MLINQTALYKKNAWAKIHYIRHILVQKTFKWKFIMAYQKQNLKEDIWIIKSSFKHGKHKNYMQLSNELWKIKASKEESVLVRNILGQYQPYNVNAKRCLLYLNEKLQIAIYRGSNMLNKQTEIIRHRYKCAFLSYNSMTWYARCKDEVSWNFWNFWSLWQSDLL